MAKVVTASATTIAHFLAKKIVSGKTGQAELAEAVSEVELQTQIKGSSFIKVHLIDPEWTIATSGLVDVSPEGLLPEVEVEFPEHSGWLWLLCACELTNELSQPNLVLTFEDKIVRELKNEWGLLRAKPGFNTRAFFIKGLVEDVARNHQPAIRFVSPSVQGAGEQASLAVTAISQALAGVESVILAAEAAAQQTSTTLTPEGEAAVKATANKKAGIAAGAGVTVKGAKADSEQIATINEVMADANGLKAGQLATEALIVACIVESEFRPNAEGSEGAKGLLQFLESTAKALNIETGNVGQEVAAVLNNPGASGKGGMISLAKANPTFPAWKIAQEEQVSSEGAASEGAANYGPWVGEARAIIAAYGGVKAAGGGGAPATSSQGEVTRGTTQNPDEDSWDCIQRLAADVNWYAFSNGHTLYYMDGPELAAQKPALYIDVPANKVTRENAQGHKVVEEGVIQVPLTSTTDNTTLEYLQDRKVKGKVQRRSRVSKPQSPAEIRLNLVCGMTDFRAGQVFYFVNSGPLNGRQIITDATRLCLKDKFTQFILEPPSLPVPENEEGKPAEHPEAPEAQVPGATEGYVNPFGQITNLTPYRIDMGVDFAGSGPIVALGDAKVFEAVSTSGWEGGAFIGYTLTSGRYKGKSIYHAENIRPTVSTGAEVKAGQTLGIMTGGTESGWATGQPQQALAASLGQQATGDPGATESPAGASFNRLLVSLGCTSGIKNPGGPGRNGSPMPPGYP